MRSTYIFLPVVSSANAIDREVFDFGTVASQVLTLRGANEGICLNLRGATVTGSTTLIVRAEWTEE